MSLPTLNTPTYELILPSSNKKIKYRPFLVKEFKILLTALESEEDEITRVLLELIDSCTFNKLDLNVLANFDIEYIFINLRAKSIGETTDLVYKCSCEHENKVQLNLLDLKVTKPDNFTNRIMVTDDVGVIMRYPKFNEMMDIYSNLNSDKVIELISNCIQTIFTQDEMFNTKEYKKEELISFVETFNKSQFEKLESFFVNMPRLIHNMQSICENCGKENDIVLEGLQNFFV